MKHHRFTTVFYCGLVALLAACNTVSSVVPTPAPKVAPSGFACPEARPRLEITSRELNLYGWAEYVPQDILDCFELVYGVEVHYDVFGSNEEMVAKVSQGTSGYDITIPADYMVALLAKRGLLSRLDKSRLPNWRNLDPLYLHQSFDPNNDYTLPYQIGTTSIAVDTGRVFTLPRSWTDLWKPEYAGRMVMVDDSRTLIGITLITLGYDLNTQDPAQLKAAKVKLADLVSGVKVFNSDSPRMALLAGDADLGVIWAGDAFQAMKESQSITYIYPSEGTIVWQDNYAILADAPHADAAYAWLNYSLQADVFWVMIGYLGYSNPNAAALEEARLNHPEVYKLYAASPVSNPPAEVIRAGHRIEDVGEAAPLYDQIWTEVKGGS